MPRTPSKRSKNDEKVATRRRKVKRKPKVETAKGHKKQKLQEQYKKTTKRGTRVAFDKLRAGKLSERGKPIVKCRACGLNGELSMCLRPSRMVIHKEIIKPDGRRVVTQYCLE